MEFSFGIGTTDQGVCRVEAHITEVFDTPEEVFARVQQPRDVVGIMPEEQPAHDRSLFLAPRAPLERWSGAELGAIQGADTARTAVLQYRRAFPRSTRTDYAITKRYEKIRYGSQKAVCKTEISATLEPDDVLAGEEDLRKNIETLQECCDERVPEEVECEPEMLATPEPEVAPCKVRKVRKDAWLPEEDDIVLSSADVDEAVIRHETAYPGKRTRAAIVARWTKYLPIGYNQSAASDDREGDPVPEQEPVDPVSPSGCPALPERGTVVRFTEAAGRVLPEKTGKVIRRDEIQGEVLVDLGASDGSVWTPPQALEVM